MLAGILLTLAIEAVIVFIVYKKFGNVVDFSKITW